MCRRLNSRNDIADLVAFIVNSDNVTAVVTQLQDRNEVQFADLDSANVTILGTANINIEDSDKYQFNFSRRLAPSETFSSDLSNCSIWTLYTEAQSLTNTSRNSLDFLICSLSRMCEDNSIENESGNETSQEDGHHNETTEEDAHQNQTAEENEQQQNQKNQQTGSSQEGNVEGHQSGQENKENETNHSSHKKCHNKSKRQIQEVTANAVVPEMYKPVVTQDSPDYLNVLRQNEIALDLYTDVSCSRPDPYWCSNYVNGYMEWQRTFNTVTTLVACQQLIQSVQYSDNRCCNSVRAAGCS
uniref:GPS domain-containing protein n=1 Tax=Syphacia muris TaxID=451379 RepID=A0A0N5B059_9BILA